jgi:hypothetical protein
MTVGRLRQEKRPQSRRRRAVKTLMAVEPRRSAKPVVDRSPFRALRQLFHQ